MELHLKIVGTLLIIVSLMHASFPRRLAWKTELDRLTLLNRQVMYVHTFFIALTLLLMGVMCLTVPGLLVSSDLGRVVSIGLFVFWLLRLGCQFFVYSPRIWRGKRFETVMHVVFSLTWAYFTVVFFIVGFGRAI